MKYTPIGGGGFHINIKILDHWLLPALTTDPSGRQRVLLALKSIGQPQKVEG